MYEQTHEHKSYHKRSDDGPDEDYSHYRHELAIKDLEKRVHVCEFINKDSQPSIDYIKSVIKRNEERAEFYKKTTYNIAGWGIMGILTAMGGLFVTVIWPSLMIKLRQYLGGF